MSSLAYTEADRRMALATPAEQRARHRSFQEKLRERAAILAAAKLAPPVVVKAPPPITVKVRATTIAPEAMPAETDPPPAPCYCSRCAAEIAAETEAASPSPAPYPKIAKIQAEVAAYYGVSILDMSSARRTAMVVRPRQIAMYLAKMLTPKSTPEIGRRFGGRDHTTVLHAFQKISGLMSSDPELAAQVAHLFNVIANGRL